jgi:hypothetical protein
VLHPVPGTESDCRGRGNPAVQGDQYPRADQAGDDPVKAGDAAVHLGEPRRLCDDHEEIEENWVSVLVIP